MAHLERRMRRLTRRWLAWLRALELLQEMKAAGLDPDVNSYSVGISACAKGTRPEGALESLPVMTWMISACAMGTPPEWAQELLLATR